jgi:hypothetical protein
VQNLSAEEVQEYIRERADLFDSQDNPFATSAWYLHFLATVGRDLRYAICEYCVGGESALILQRLENRCIAVGYYSPLVTPVVGRQDHFAELIRQVPTPVLDLSPIDADIAKGIQGGGWHTRTYRCSGNWFQPCEGISGDKYMAGRSSQTLNTWKRKGKKFGGRLELLTNPSDAEIEAYGRVYANSWKGHEESPEFVAGWIRVCAREGWLRLGMAWLDDVPVGVAFWFVRNGKAYIYKLAHDEAYANLSTGTLLTAMLFRHVLDVDRVVEVDYLTGDDAYKREWTNCRRQRVGVIASNMRTARGMLRAMYEAAGSLTSRVQRTTAESQ